MTAALAGIAALLLANGDTLAGSVRDRDGRPVAGAVVALPEVHRATLSDADGRFRLAGIAPGRYTLTVRAPGFAALAQEVSVAGATALDLVLERTALVMEPVTVTATRAPLQAGGSPLPAVALSGERLRRDQAASLAHALAGLPGLDVLATGQQIGKPVIRGLAGARVLVLADGSRLEDYSWSDEDGPSVDVRLAERVEVIRGPASVLYGSDAVGGVINVLPRELPGVAGAPRTAAELGVASNNAELSAAASAEGRRGPLAWRLSGVGRHAGNLHTPAGELDNTGFGSLAGEAAVGVRGTAGGATLRYTRYGGEFQLLEAEGPPPGGMEPGGPERKLSDDRVQFAGDYLAGGVRLEARAQWQRHWLAEVADTGTGPGGAPLEGTTFDLLLNTLTLDVLAHHALAGRMRGTAGLSGLYQTNDSRGRVPLVPDARVRSAAAFLFEEWPLGRWSLLAGGRVDLRHLATDANAALGLPAETRDYTAVSGNVGLVFRPRGALALTANAGRAWRAPTLFELFANGPHLGEARYEIGDPNLEPEAATNVDVGVRWTGSRLRAEVAAYRNAVARYVFIAPTGQVRDSLRVYRYEQADALLLGAEAALGVELSAALSARARAQAVRGTNRATGEPLPLVPPARAAVGAELHGTGPGPTGRASLGAEVEVVTRQTRLNPLDVPTAGYALVNLSAGVERQLAGRAARLDVTVRNVANTRYRSFLSRYKEFALDPGRNVVVRFSLGD